MIREEWTEGDCGVNSSLFMVKHSFHDNSFKPAKLLTSD